MLDTYVPSVVRTLAGYLVAWLLSLKFAGPILDAMGQAHASDADRERLVSFGVLVIGTLYYAAVRAAERKWPQLTYLLGSKRQPVAYAEAAPPASAGSGSAAGVIPPSVDLNAGLDATGAHAAPETLGTTGAPYMGGG